MHCVAQIDQLTDKIIIDSKSSGKNKQTKKQNAECVKNIPSTLTKLHRKKRQAIRQATTSSTYKHFELYKVIQNDYGINDCGIIPF